MDGGKKGKWKVWWKIKYEKRSISRKTCWNEQDQTLKDWVWKTENHTKNYFAIMRKKIEASRK